MVCAVVVSHQGWFCLTLMYLHKEQLQCKCFLSHAPHIDRFIQLLPLLQHQLLSFFLWVEFVLFLFAAGHDSRLVFRDNTGHSFFSLPLWINMCGQRDDDASGFSECQRIDEETVNPPLLSSTQTWDNLHRLLDDMLVQPADGSHCWRVEFFRVGFVFFIKLFILTFENKLLFLEWRICFKIILKQIL